MNIEAHRNSPRHAVACDHGAGAPLRRVSLQPDVVAQQHPSVLVRAAGEDVDPCFDWPFAAPDALERAGSLPFAASHGIPAQLWLGAIVPLFLVRMIMVCVWAVLLEEHVVSATGYRAGRFGARGCIRIA
jgi:hypothetical protein